MSKPYPTLRSTPRPLATIGLLSAVLLGACSHTRPPRPASPSPAQAREGNRPGPKANGRRNVEPKPYNEVVTPEAVTDSGLIILHRIDEKLLFEIPDSILDREILLVTRRARTAESYGYGGMKNNTQTIRWQRIGKKIFLRVVSYENVADDSLPIYQAVRNANFESIVRAFPIEAFNQDTTTVVIDATSLFTKNVPMLGIESRTRKRFKIKNLDESRSFVQWAKSFPRNVEVRHVLTYNAAEPPSNASNGALSVEMNQSMILLPDKPMMSRLWDERVGFFRITQTDYGRSDQKVKERRYITRWRLEPKDPAAFSRGEPVEPVKPIVYYIDRATPVKWRRYLKQGVESWNVAFAAAGFKNAIIAKDAPSSEEDPEYSPEDVRYSVFRWYPSQTQNASGPHVHDPRTGEILESDINWYHNVLNLARDWYIVQTGAANPEARQVTLADSVMGKLIRFVAAHEVGHTLGLAHNMKASAAYPVDSLRSASFTCSHGTAPSIMDYARFNYVAQPEDAGVCFTPEIGAYDEYAIRWGYRPIPSAKSADAEKATLDRWIKDVYADPTFYFGDPSREDPTSLTEALGDDAVKASAYGIANLKRIVPQLVEWTYREGEDYSELQELYTQVSRQWNRYMGHVATNIGGIVRTRKTYDQKGKVYEFVPEDTQRRALTFLSEQAFEPPTWMVDEEILSRIESVGTVERMRRLQVGVLNQVLTPGRMERLIEASAREKPEAYSLGEMLTDLREAVWSELRAGRSIGTYRRNLQRGYLARMEWLMTEEPEALPVRFRGRGFTTPVNVAQSDIRAHVRGELEALQRQVRQALARRPNTETRLHLRDVLVRIDRILNPKD